MSEEDRRLLCFMAEHRLVLERQLGRLVGVRTDDPGLKERLACLTREGLIRGRRFDETHHQITKRGLVAIGSPLPAPKHNLATYDHDVGVAWLWLGAHAGMFGSLREVIGERRLRSYDGALKHPEDPYGVRLGGFDRFGNERLHYPDLLLIDRYGRRLALELELSAKGHARRESILAGYGADNRIDRVLYLVKANSSGRGIRRAMEAIVRNMGLSERIRFQPIREFSPAPDHGGSRGRTASRGVQLDAALELRRTEAAR